MEPKDILSRLKTVGWQKGGYGGINTSNCIVGAAVICRMEQENLSWKEAQRGWAAGKNFKEISKVLIENYPETCIEFQGRMFANIPAFNDSPKTTFEDVERVLEKAQVLVDEKRGLQSDS